MLVPQHAQGQLLIPVNVVGIPSELKNLKRWVVWRAEHHDNGKFGKIPTDTVSGLKLRWSDSGNWMRFVDAVAAYERGGFGGIGIVLSNQHPVKVNRKDLYLVALDYDSAASSMTEIKEDWLALGKPYLEVSPSGKGLHMFALSAKPPKGGNKGNGREMYSSGRFMTVTGHSTKGTIKEATSELITLEQKWFQSKASAISAPPSTPQPPPQKTVDQVQRVLEALAFLTPDCSYEQWRTIVGAILSTGWDSAVDIARDWSRGIEQIEGHTRAFEEHSFQTVVSSFDPTKGITLGSLFHYARAEGWAPSRAPISGKDGPPMPLALTKPFTGLLTPDEVQAIPTAPYRIRGVLPQEGLAAIYGEAGSGKSFLVLDLIFAIAAGHNEWFGIRAKQAPVVYVGLEGRGGIAKRIKAWEVQSGVPAPTNARFWLEDFTLNNSPHADQLADRIVEELGEGGVIVIDTLNQAAPGADENSSVDMGNILNNAKRLAGRTKSLVILVHHLGKDKTRGLRGHSSLIAALDAAVEVVNGAAGRSWRVTKAKDDESGVSRDFDLRTHFVGTDEDGLDVTSCAIAKAIHSPAARISPPKGKNQIACMHVLKQMCREQPSGVDERAAIDAVAAVLDCAPGRRKTVAKDTIAVLVVRGNLKKIEGGFLLHE